MNCTTCGRALPDSPSYAAGIWVQVLGGEYGYAYVACPACGAYTESCTRDFVRGDREYSSRVISKSEGDALVSLIHTCWDALGIFCTCPAHAYFRHGFPIGPVILV